MPGSSRIALQRPCLRLVHLGTLLVLAILAILFTLFLVQQFRAREAHAHAHAHAHSHASTGLDAMPTPMPNEPFRVGSCPVPSHRSANSMQCNLLPNLIHDLNVHNEARGGNRPALAVAYPPQCLDCQPIIRNNTMHNLSQASHKHLSESHAQTASIGARNEQQKQKLAVTSVDQSTAVNTMTKKYGTNHTNTQLQGRNVTTVDSRIREIQQELREIKHELHKLEQR